MSYPNIGIALKEEMIRKTREWQFAILTMVPLPGLRSKFGKSVFPGNQLPPKQFQKSDLGVEDGIEAFDRKFTSNERRPSFIPSAYHGGLGQKEDRFPTKSENFTEFSGRTDVLGKSDVPTIIIA